MAFWLPLTVAMSLATSGSGQTVFWGTRINITGTPGVLQRTAPPAPNVKWSAGGFSVVRVESVSFKTSGMPDAVVGLSLTTRGRFSYFDIDYGIEVRRTGFAYVMERGAIKKYIGPYAAGDEFKIIRNRRTIVRYYKNDILFYESGVLWTNAKLVVHGVTASDQAQVYDVQYFAYDPLPTAKTKCWDLSSCDGTLLYADEMKRKGVDF